ncbi:hypothetical protein PZ897_10550 [Hoeflea sp. YIM 152468]|uniref:hypothetical protein n=1 Tax=Hoeflea sp. YIM 152468 TaxID=3031759 RepID=UPI0023DAF592|nr:hypothetical protein [Hoeflea sp. YIM 152468]MDF1608616.1 hypothetical protein [Hoeflea sp. YIM 152468]
MARTFPASRSRAAEQAIGQINPSFLAQKLQGLLIGKESWFISGNSPTVNVLGPNGLGIDLTCGEVHSILGPIEILLPINNFVVPGCAGKTHNFISFRKVNMFFFQQPETLPVFGPEIEKLERILDVLRELDLRMTIGALSAFVFIARRLHVLASGDENLRNIAHEMQIPYPSLLRHTDLLSEGIPQKIEGIRLFEKGRIRTTSERGRLSLPQKD